MRQTRAPRPFHSRRQLDRRWPPDASLRPPEHSCVNRGSRGPIIDGDARSRYASSNFLVKANATTRFTAVVDAATARQQTQGIAVASARRPNRNRSAPVRTSTSRPRSCRKAGYRGAMLRPMPRSRPHSRQTANADLVLPPPTKMASWNRSGSAKLASGRDARNGLRKKARCAGSQPRDPNVA